MKSIDQSIDLLHSPDPENNQPTHPTPNQPILNYLVLHLWSPKFIILSDMHEYWLLPNFLLLYKNDIHYPPLVNALILGDIYIADVHSIRAGV